MATKKRIPVKRLLSDMDRLIEYSYSSRKRKPARIQLTVAQFDAVREHLGKTEYRGIPLEAVQ